ncbi:hypothetical protein VP1G_09104 [Cytospora mali]|uniref:F-box domain-containing protein n=1 Tax=Cytospora mali TaxID=578113 RepID=A0A194VD87_CYTMA|nr:hypothetical protein VP1G_09104 [Valsa mali var. pyri (nom. inval.)]
MSSINTLQPVERWIVGHRYNQAQLNGTFPDEIWVNIINQVDNATIWSLRNTCRFFMGLCEIKDVARGRCDAWRPDKIVRPQQTAWWGINAHQDGVKHILNVVQFCVPCMQWRTLLPERTSSSEVQMSSWECPIPGGLTCSECKIQHPVILHSAPEREKIKGHEVAPLASTCVGRQAHLPICEHVSITWDKILQFNNSIEMKKEEHRSNHQHHLVCRHASHNQTCAPNTVPRATFSYYSSQPAGHIEIRTQWEAAIVKLPVDSNTGEPLRVSYNQLQNLVSSAMQGNESAPRLLCPHLRWDDHSLLRPFDPIYCCCLGADIPLLHDAERCKLRGLADDCCLCQSSVQQAIGKFLPFSGKGTDGSQLASHKASCTDCGTWFSWTRRKHPVTGEQTLWLNMGSVVILDRKKAAVEEQVSTSEPDPCDMNWLGRIDPASVPGHWDQEPLLKHLTWCDDSNCATSYRGRARMRVLRQIGERQSQAPEPPAT